MTCPNTCQNASRAFCTSLLRSANALFAGTCCGFFMPKNIFFSGRTKFLLISENTVLTGGLKCVGAAGEIITLNLNGKVMLLLKQQGRSRLNLQHASHLFLSPSLQKCGFCLVNKWNRCWVLLDWGHVFVCLVSWSLFYLYHRNSNNCKLRACLEIEPLF